MPGAICHARLWILFYHRSLLIALTRDARLITGLRHVLIELDVRLPTPMFDGSPTSLYRTLDVYFTATPIVRGLWPTSVYHLSQCAMPDTPGEPDASL